MVTSSVKFYEKTQLQIPIAMATGTETKPDVAGVLEMFAAVSSTAVTLPQFWKDNPKAWYKRIEAQFQLKNITTPDTKVNHILAKLDGPVTEGLMDILEEEGPTTQGTYDAIKRRLCRIYELTPEQRADRLLEMAALGDRRPTELMQEILKLAGKEDIKFLIKRIFMRCLPNNVRTAIGNEASLTPIDLAKLAENHWLNDKSGPSGNHTTTVAAVEKSQGKKERIECRYHKQWGEKARRCNPKCPRFAEFKAKKKDNQNKASVAEAIVTQDLPEAWDPMTDPKNF